MESSYGGGDSFSLRKSDLDTSEQHQGKKIVGCKWVFKNKDDAEGVRYKARLVAKGYSQIEGVDFNGVFSLVVKHSSIRILPSLVAMKIYELEQLNVKTVFLHGDLEEQIYMQQPKGYRITGREICVYLLKKSLYGLKQFSGNGIESLMLLWRVSGLVDHNMIIVSILRSWLMGVTCIYFSMWMTC